MGEGVVLEKRPAVFCCCAEFHLRRPLTFVLNEMNYLRQSELNQQA